MKSKFVQNINNKIFNIIKDDLIGEFIKYKYDNAIIKSVLIYNLFTRKNVPVISLYIDGKEYDYETEYEWNFDINYTEDYKNKYMYEDYFYNNNRNFIYLINLNLISTILKGE